MTPDLRSMTTGETEALTPEEKAIWNAGYRAACQKVLADIRRVGEAAAGEMAVLLHSKKAGAWAIAKGEHVACLRFIAIVQTMEPPA